MPPLEIITFVGQMAFGITVSYWTSKEAIGAWKRNGPACWTAHLVR
jgi:hypothetical protein